MFQLTEGLTPQEVENIISSASGWSVYNDSVHTVASPQTIAEGVTATLTNNANGALVSQQPDDAPLGMFDPVTNKFTPLNTNDYYMWILRFKAKNTRTNGGYVNVGIDIGGSFGTIFTESHIFIRGANVEQTFNCVMGGYTGSTFIANGGIPTVTSGAGISTIYDKEWHVVRIHKGR